MAEQQEYFEILKKTKEVENVNNEEEELLLQEHEELNDETQLTTTATITSKQQQQQLTQDMATRLTGSTNTTNNVAASSSSILKRGADSERENYGFSLTNTTTGANVFANSNNQSLNKFESERLVCAANITGVTNNFNNINNNNNTTNNSVTIGVISVSGNNQNSVSGGNSAGIVKISQKLQENQFIKNEQQQQQLNTKKFLKFKQNTVTCASFSSEDLKSPNKLPTSNSATSLAGAAATFLPSTSGNCLVKKKMVAVQEMKKSNTPNTNSATHLSPCLATNRLNNRVGAGGGAAVESSELDTNEDLSYGPGIVSKLRCRYLSLALRESMEQQRLNKDQLRRSTSLNNLLDNCDEDENDEEEEEEEGEEQQRIVQQQDFIYENFKQDSPKKTGILKTSLNKTPEKRFSSANNQGSNGVGVTFTETSYNKRSRHLKRGNDSLKRARSVEALLSEKSPWHTRANSSAPCTNQVSIEDKIHNARERLQQGTDHLPPKRLTSIIDDTERPPPDLVKQTLKMFEASANRRPRATNRSNCKGEVASKVETFKNIIKEQKPNVNSYPKALSPTKKVNISPQQKPLKTSTPQANDLLQSPLGRKALNKAMGVNNSAESLTPLKGHNSLLSEHTPDIIPRQKFTQERSHIKEPIETNNKEKPLIKRDLNKEKFQTVTDSPITALSKELSKMKLNDNTPTKSGSDNCSNSSSNSDNKIGGVAGVVNVDDDGDACQQRHNQYPPYNNDLINEESNNSLKNENDKIINNKKSNKTEAATTSNNTIAMKNEATVSNYDCLTKKTDKEVEEEDDDNNVDDASTPPPSSSDLSDGGEDDDHDTGDLKTTNSKRITRTALDNIAKAGYTQQFKFNNTTTNSPQTSSSSSHTTTSTSALNTGKQIGVIRPLLNTQQQQQQQKINESSSTMETLKHSSSSSPNNTNLTSREIEKNRINDLKKSNTTNNSTHQTTTSHTSSASSSPSASLDHHVIKSTTTTTTSATSATSGYSDVDSVISATNSPLWAMRKRRQAPPAAPAENTSMVFNFSNRKEVPDYIENDGVIFRRKRELPKPNESGFVLLGDLSVETSTDMDYDDFSMCPPSPCDVEFVNANIVIDGKSSIRQKSKDTTFRVQFNDTLTSTFEYPSEASLIVDDSFSAYNESYTQPLGSSPTHDVNDFTHAFQNLCLENISSTIPPLTQHHHHVADEIIQLPTTNLNASSSPPATANNTNNSSSATKNILGNLPLGSAPLGFYTPLKAPIDRLFQLGVTRAPSLLISQQDSPTETTAAAAANCKLFNGTDVSSVGGSIVGISDGLITDDMDMDLKKQEEPDSLQYIKPAEDDLNMAYSEGTQKTDLLY